MVLGIKSPKQLIKYLLILGLVAGALVLYSKMRENFDTEIDQGKAKYDDALEKRIAEVKEEHPRFDAELLLDVNRPSEIAKEDDKGWWANVINCRKNGDLQIYCKQKADWIWPY